MEAISVKFSAQLRSRIVEEARRRNVSQSTIIREAVERALSESAPERRPTSCADLAVDLIGSVRSGRKDLATDKAVLAEALMENFRGRQRHR